MRHFVILLCCVTSTATAQTRPLDVIIVGGRVIDPETGLDAARNVGVRAGRIVAIASASVTPVARDTIDARGLVVSPGFIDLHSHGQDSLNYALQARDGVTTALELEMGVYPVAPWYAMREGRTPINFGTAVGHLGARRAMLDRDSSVIDSDIIKHPGRFVRAPIADADFPALISRMRAGLRDGGLGVGMGINYAPAISRSEVATVFGLAAQERVPVFVHMRYAGLIDSVGAVVGLQELLADAAVSGASLHVCHITSMGLGLTPTLLSMIDGARKRGLDVSTELYPYPAAATSLQSAFFDPGFDKRLGISYGDILWPPTGERLTEATFARYRQQGGTAVVFMIPPIAITSAVKTPYAVIASDGYLWLADGRVLGHPRGAGTYSRVLGPLVRDEHLLTLPEAIRRMTLLPAQRLERMSPAMRRKGRVQVGADADLTVFDPQRIRDVATFDDPGQASRGIVYVLVNGMFVVRNEALLANALPGRPIKAGARPVQQR